MNLLSIFTFVAVTSNFQINVSETLKFSSEVQEVVTENQYNSRYFFSSVNKELDYEKTVKTLSVIGLEESGFTLDNYKLGDNGKACSIMQLHPGSRFGISCERLQSSRKVALDTGLKFLVYLKKFCGGKSVRKSFFAYASGKCEDSNNKMAEEIVNRRCKLIGGC